MRLPPLFLIAALVLPLLLLAAPAPVQACDYNTSAIRLAVVDHCAPAIIERIERVDYVPVQRLEFREIRKVRQLEFREVKRVQEVKTIQEIKRVKTIQRSLK